MTLSVQHGAKTVGALAGTLVPGAAFAQDVEGGVNISAISMFFAFVLATLFITYWAAQRTKTAKDYYAAGGGISGFQNGLAISGDYMSAASFLGISALVFGSGYDGLIYSIGFLVGWPIILTLLAERLRNLGKYTFSDVVSYRLQQRPVRAMAASGSLVVVLLYLIAQMVGAGALIQILFGLPYEYAVVIVGVLMVIYVTIGGMLATTWVQIIKACLLLGGATVLAFLVLYGVGFSVSELFERAVNIHRNGIAIMGPGGFLENSFDAVSLGLALMLGTAGLPHILMRFFTVPDAKQARRSVFYATGFIGYFYILTFVIGFGAIVFLTENPAFQDASGGLLGGDNMAAVHLSAALGGDLFLGFISAVAFATILAVVSGLTLAGAAAVSHDLYANCIKSGKVHETQEVRVSRFATVGLGAAAILFGIAFEGQNIAYLVGLAFALAASANFPVLFYSMYWKGLTTRGAVIGGWTGLTVAVVLFILGPTVWVELLGFGEAIFPSAYPALISVITGFAVTFLVSKTDKSASAANERDAFSDQYVRSMTGVGAEEAAKI